MVHWPAFGFPPPTIAARCGFDCAAATAASATAILKIRLFIVITLRQTPARCGPFDTVRGIGPRMLQAKLSERRARFRRCRIGGDYGPRGDSCRSDFQSPVTPRVRHHLLAARLTGGRP